MRKHTDLESPIHRSIINYLNWQYPTAVITHAANEGNRGGRAGLIDGVRKKAMGQRAGFPDILMWYQGNFWTFEVKAPKKYAEIAQKVCGEDIIANGGRWAVVRSIDDVKAQIKLWQADGVGVVELRG